MVVILFYTGLKYIFLDEDNYPVMNFGKKKKKNEIFIVTFQIFHIEKTFQLKRNRFKKKSYQWANQAKLKMLGGKKFLIFYIGITKYFSLRYLFSCNNKQVNSCYEGCQTY